MKTYQITVGVGYRADGSAITEQERGALIKVLRNEAAVKFLGATFTQGDGVWGNDKGQVVAEPVLIITICGENLLIGVRHYAAFCRGAASQNCVAVNAWESDFALV